MSDNEPIVSPVEPNPFWKMNAQKIIGESISTTEDVAKQLITITSLLEGIYFHAIAISDIKLHLSYITSAIYLMPILFWLLSLIFAILALSPKVFMININSSRDSKEKFEDIASRKFYMLTISEYFLVISFVALFAAIAHYLILIPIPTQMSIPINPHRL